jgi:hypothetical protein
VRPFLLEEGHMHLFDSDTGANLSFPGANR